jgi:dihydrofolate synthase/folylpolyglutamate synthase
VRTRPASELHAYLHDCGAQVTAHADVQAALQAQCARASAGDEILLFGSFYCVAEALDWLARQASGDLRDGFAG